MEEVRTPVYLLMVTTNNNNKYYKMIPRGDFFDVEYGRIGATCTRASYSMSQWDKKYREKIKKGYIDQSHLVQDLVEKEKPTKDGYKEIENKVIAEIVQRLQSMARQKVQESYKVSSNQVTQAMVDEAQNVIDELMALQTEVDNFNNVLLKLFTVIPRRMGNVNDHLATSKDDFARILKDEQDLLDVMRGQVVTHIAEDQSDDNEETSDNTILDAMGLVFEETNDEDVRKIKELLGESSGRYYNSWRVTNVKTRQRFEDFVKNEGIKEVKCLWHGSRNENWWSIINTGLVLRPTNAVITGKLYGNGIYFAPRAQKSIGYTSLSGSYWARGSSSSAFMAVMEVAYGTPYDVYSFDDKYGNLDYNGLQRFQTGANCLHAHAGADMGYGRPLRNDEIIIYKEEQCTIKFLVELR